MRVVALAGPQSGPGPNTDGSRSGPGADTIERPIWRRFRPLYAKLAIAHARAGGAAVLVPRFGPLDVILPVEASGRVTLLGLWALYAIEHRRIRYVREGAAKGLARARIRPAYEGSVLDWCARDAVHAGAVRAIELDCLACAACCHDAEVVLDEADLDRWKKAERPELARRAYVRRARDGKITLRFVTFGILCDSPGPTPRAKAVCPHLAPDRACGIYSIRPDNCRAFVAGSEACLAAREDTLGLRDGAAREEA